jgi:chromate transport protein ChrA
MSASAIMAIIAGVLLLFSFGRGRNTVWGGAALGAIIGVIVALITSNWDWLLFIFAAGTFIGVISRRLLREVYLRWKNPRKNVYSTPLTLPIQKP